MWGKLGEEFAALAEQWAYDQEQLAPVATRHPERRRLKTLPGLGP